MQTPTSQIIDRNNLATLPTLPGVYLFRNQTGKVIYVGKAKNLRNRVRSYFQNSRALDPKTQRLVEKVASIEVILVDSEVEALILEANLIKEHKPRYNVILRDDKSYPYIRITNEPYPRVFVTRKIVRDGSRYLGPYTDVKDLRHIMKTMRRVFPVRSCHYYIDDKVIASGKIKLCLDYHIQRCQGPCQGLVSQEEYNQMIHQVEQFLKGKTRDLVHTLRERMEKAAQEMRFEEAARLRDQIQMIENYYFKGHKVVLTDFEDRDIVALAHEDEDACVVVFKIRDGKVVGRQHFYLESVADNTPEQILSSFLKQFYMIADTIPRHLTLPLLPEEADTLRHWLEGKAGGKVYLEIPQRGDKHQLISLAQKNARFLLDELLLQKMKKSDYVAFNVRELQKALKLDKPPRRIEAFDISNIQGQDAVASLVTFVNGKPRKSDYRIFKIRTKSTPDDFAMMYEAVYRRYKRVQEEGQPMPDLILIDGGRGQLNSALKALQELGITHQPIIGLAKRLEEIYHPDLPDPQTLPRRNAGLRLLQHIRDESHRFAVHHFRKQHTKRLLHSPLDDVPGIGPRRKERLLKVFGSLKKIREASVDELIQKGNIPRKVAEAVVSILNSSTVTSPEKR